MNIATAETSLKSRNLHLDLRGKNPDEVVAILRENGYTDISKRLETGWGEFSMFNTDPKPEHKKQTVWRITIDEREAPNLTVVVWNGKEKTLEPGHDLHYFEAEGDLQGGWGWARTSYLYK